MKWLDLFNKTFKSKRGKENFKQKLFEQRKRKALAAVKSWIPEYQKSLEASKDDFEAQDSFAQKIKNQKIFLSKISRSRSQQELDNLLTLKPAGFDYELEGGMKIFRKRRRGRDWKSRPIATDVHEGQEETKKDLEYAVTYLVKKHLLHKDAEVRTQQIQSLRPWINYLVNTFTSDSGKLNFIYFIMRGLLQYEINWEKRQSKNTKKVFPNFDYQHTPAILGILYTVLYNQNLDNRIGNANEVLFVRYPGLKEALEEGDFKEMYQVVRRREMMNAQLREGGQFVEGSGQWATVFSFKNEDGSEKSEKEKDDVATHLAQVCENAFSNFCIKGKQTAINYLKEGDIYLYLVKKKIEIPNESGGVDDLFINVPEIAIQTLENEMIKLGDGAKGYIDESDRYRINENEVHGSGPNQSIRPEFLPVAREFVMQKNPKTGEYRFKNAEDLEVKLLDAEMLEQVKNKIRKICELIESGVEVKQGDKNDLSSRELKFLYAVYRPVKGFDLDGGLFGSELMEWQQIRFMKMTNAEKLGYVAPDFLGRDLEKIFDVNFNEIKGEDDYYIYDGIPPCKIFMGPTSLENFVSMKESGPFEEISGALTISNNFDKNLIKDVKKIGGVLLTEEDRENIANRKWNQFPPKNDRRLVGVYLQD